MLKKQKNKVQGCDSKTSYTYVLLKQHAHGRREERERSERETAAAQRKMQSAAFALSPSAPLLKLRAPSRSFQNPSSNPILRPIAAISSSSLSSSFKPKPISIHGAFSPLAAHSPILASRLPPPADREVVARSAAEGSSGEIAGEKSAGSGLVQTLQLGALFGLWYLFNIYFNIYNKQVISLLLIAMISWCSAVVIWATLKNVVKFMYCFFLYSGSWYWQARFKNSTALFSCSDLEIIFVQFPLSWCSFYVVISEHSLVLFYFGLLVFFWISVCCWDSMAFNFLLFGYLYARPFSRSVKSRALQELIIKRSSLILSSAWQCFCVSFLSGSETFLVLSSDLF